MMTAPPENPTDLELMLYFDDELPPHRRSEVAAWLARDAAAAGKLDGLHLGAALVREQAAPPADARGPLADRVMAEIERPAPNPERRRSGARPANDNARVILAVAAALAVAAGTLLWARMGQVGRFTDARKAVAELAMPGPPAEPPLAVGDAPEVLEGEHGVEIASVEFGSRGGTIFYASREAASASPTMTVVWLAEDGEEP